MFKGYLLLYLILRISGSQKNKYTPALSDRKNAKASRDFSHFIQEGFRVFLVNGLVDYHILSHIFWQKDWISYLIDLFNRI